MDSGTIYVCEHKPEGVINTDVFRSTPYCYGCEEAGKSMIKCFHMTMTPVDKDMAAYPQGVMDIVKQDILMLGQGMIIKTQVERIVHSEKVKFDRFIHYPAEHLTIGMIKRFRQDKRYLMFPKD